MAVSDSVNSIKELVSDLLRRIPSETPAHEPTPKQTIVSPPPLQIPEKEPETIHIADSDEKQSAQLKRDIEVLTHKNKELEDALRHSEEKNSTLSADVRRLEDSAKVSKKEESKGKGHLDSLTKEISKERDIVRQEVEALTSYKSTIDHATSKLLVLVTGLSTRVDEFDGYRQRKEEEVVTLRERLSEAQQKWKEKEQSLLSAKEEMGTLHYQIEKLEAVHKNQEQLYQVNEQSRQNLAKLLEEEVQLHRKAKDLLSEKSSRQEALEDKTHSVEKLRAQHHQETEKMKFKLKCAEQMLHEERKSVVDLKLEAKRKSDASLAVIGNLQKQVQRLERTEKDLLSEIQKLRNVPATQQRGFTLPHRRGPLGKRPLVIDPDEIEEPVDDDSLALDFGDLYYGTKRTCTKCSEPVLVDSLSGNKSLVCKRCHAGSSMKKKRRG